MTPRTLSRNFHALPELAQINRLPAGFDITNHIIPSENQLIAKVTHCCDGGFLEDQGHWWMAH